MSKTVHGKHANLKQPNKRLRIFSQLMRELCFRWTENRPGSIPARNASVQRAERYLGCKQRIRRAVNEHMGIEAYRREPSFAGRRLQRQTFKVGSRMLGY
jgi:hypothetical protein